MIYRINKTNYHDFRTISVNALSPRTYFIPYPDRESAESVSLRQKRYESPKVVCLNGDWDFRFYPLPSELPDMLDTGKVAFEKISVPSCWQFKGYAKPFYVNDRYQFPYKPPEIPQDEKAGKVFSWFGVDQGLGPKWRDPGNEYNYAGVYRKTFDIEDPSKRYVISFLGCASCLDVYLNGEFIGYGEGSHNTSEFDLTKKVKKGENELVVIVRRWCTGTYLECQDMFRNNGIFRDVLLRISDDTDISDISVETAKMSSGPVYDAVVRAGTYSDTSIKFTLKGHGIEQTLFADSEYGKAEVLFSGLKVKEWNAETPFLYDLYIETPTCCVIQRIGFRDVTIDGNVFLLNGKKLKFHGVNHHDSSPVNGYAMSPEEIEKDVRLCKEYNIDTVRTSHYPPDPYLLELCDELGIYVIDEADLETHGTVFHKLPPSYNRISDDPKWAGHYVDRIRHLYERDKTHPSIVMWSLGNESGGTFNTDLMYMYLKDHTNIPVHYESAVHTKRKAYDVASEMYPPVSRLHDIGEKKCRTRQFMDRPYFLCEYAHAMGVGPGGMEDYWKEIYSYDCLMGGCVWEMADHAVLHDDGTYTYGGDHGEWEHDGNFCVDGMFYPDRSPSTGAKIVRFVYRPLIVTYLGDGKIEIFNTKAFTEGTEYLLELAWSDGSSEEIIPDVHPLEKKIIKIETAPHIEACKKEGISCLLTVITREHESLKELSREQLAICSGIRNRQAGNAPDIVISSGKPEISAGGLSFTASDPYTILFRAPMDNDLALGGVRNTMAPFMNEKEKVISVLEENGRTIVKTAVSCRGHSFLCTDEYVRDDAGLLITSTLHCTRGGGNLPRFGKAFRLESSFDKVEYYGRNGESYADMKDQAQIEHVSCAVSDMTEPNIRPQESGNRMDTEWASVSDGSHTVTFSSEDGSFELGIKPYRDTYLAGMKHREDEKTTGTYVTVSAFQQGVGTGICGPGPSPDTLYPARRDYVLRFRISIK